MSGHGGYPEYVKTVPPEINTFRSEPILYHREQTLKIVYDCLARCGLGHWEIINAISDMQNRGIYFREARAEENARSGTKS